MSPMARYTTIPQRVLGPLYDRFRWWSAYARLDGLLALVQVWMDWDGQHVLTSSPKGSYMGRALRGNPEFAVSALDHRDPWRFANVTGRVIAIRDDEGLAVINRLSHRSPIGRWQGFPWRATSATMTR